MIEDYLEINDIEAGCDCVPWDMLDIDEAFDKQLLRSEVFDDELTYARYRLLKESEICDKFRRDNPRILDFCGELYERLIEEVN